MATFNKAAPSIVALSTGAMLQMTELDWTLEQLNFDALGKGVQLEGQAAKANADAIEGAMHQESVSMRDGYIGDLTGAAIGLTGDFTSRAVAAKLYNKGLTGAENEQSTAQSWENLFHNAGQPKVGQVANQPAPAGAPAPVLTHAEIETQLKAINNLNLKLTAPTAEHQAALEAGHADGATPQIKAEVDKLRTRIRDQVKSANDRVTAVQGQKDQFIQKWTGRTRLGSEAVQASVKFTAADAKAAQGEIEALKSNMNYAYSVTQEINNRTSKLIDNTVGQVNNINQIRGEIAQSNRV